MNPSLRRAKRIKFSGHSDFCKNESEAGAFDADCPQGANLLLKTSRKALLQSQEQSLGNPGAPRMQLTRESLTLRPVSSMHSVTIG